MPKLKTRKCAAKRLKETGTGKFRHHKAGGRHLKSAKNAKRRRRLRSSRTQLALRLLQLLLTSQNIHRQFLKIIQILLIHLIQHRRILHQPNLMLFQSIRDLFHIHFRFGILILHILNLRRLLLKKAKQTFLLGSIKILQLSYHACQKISHFPKILCPYILKCSI
mgnify:CR=1 FL=1